VNTLRGLLRELGIVIPEGIEKVLPQVRLLVADAESGLPDSLRGTVAAACSEIESLGERIRDVERQLEALAEQTPVVERLRSVPGIGLMTSTALVAFVGDVQRFPSGRHFASYLGLTPREYSTGLRHRLGRISKRGDSYLRLLLVHGARSVLCHAKKSTSHDRLRTWALSLQKRSRHNKAAVALANKLARIAWAVWKRDREYESVVAA
jgi:transposase